MGSGAAVETGIQHDDWPDGQPVTEDVPIWIGVAVVPA